MNAEHHARSVWCWLLPAMGAFCGVQAQVDNIYIYGTAKSFDPTLKVDTVLVSISDALGGHIKSRFAVPPDYKYDFDLSYDATHQLLFRAPGHFSERLVINAAGIPASDRIGGFGMNINMILIPRLQDPDSSEHTGVLATARYDKSSHQLMWTTDSLAKAARDKLLEKCQVLIDQKRAHLFEEQVDSLGFTYPAIPIRTRDQADFIPTGWNVWKSSEPDLNQDGISDLLLMLEFSHPVSHVRPGGGRSRSAPRSLLVAIGNRKGEYELLACNTSFLLRADESDPGQTEMDVSCRYGQLTFRYQFARSYASYTFTFQDDSLVLVHYDGARSTASGDLFTTTANLAVNGGGDVSTRSRRAGEESWSNEQYLTLPKSIRLTLDQLPMALRTEILPVLFL